VHVTYRSCIRVHLSPRSTTNHDTLHDLASVTQCWLFLFNRIFLDLLPRKQIVLGSVNEDSIIPLTVLSAVVERVFQYKILGEWYTRKSFTVICVVLSCVCMISYNVLV